MQREDFDLGAELAALRAGRTDIGALVSFTGLVRDATGGGLEAMELEHYPGHDREGAGRRSRRRRGRAGRCRPA